MRNTGGIVRVTFDLESQMLRVDFRDGTFLEISGFRVSDPDRRTVANLESFPDEINNSRRYPDEDPDMGMRRAFSFETFIVGGALTVSEPDGV